MSRVFGGCRALMAASKAAAKPGRKASSKESAAAARTSPLAKEIPVSLAMGEFLGVPEISRPAAIKKLWEYVKLHHLQNPENKRQIFCDDKLKTIFGGKDTVAMTEVMKLIQVHFIKPK